MHPVSRPCVFVLIANAKAHYLREGEASKGEKARSPQIGADATTSFTILLAIFFPSVTGTVFPVEL